MKVLFVCHANICRSFMAQEILKKHLPEAEVRSRGLYAAASFRVPEKVQKFLVDRQINVPRHGAVQLAESDLQWADYIFFMEEAQLEQTADRFAQYSDKFYLLLDYAFDQKIDLSDPIGLQGKSFEKQAARLYEAVSVLADKLDSARRQEQNHSSRGLY